MEIMTTKLARMLKAASPVALKKFLAAVRIVSGVALSTRMTTAQRPFLPMQGGTKPSPRMRRMGLSAFFLCGLALGMQAQLKQSCITEALMV